MPQPSSHDERDYQTAKDLIHSGLGQIAPLGIFIDHRRDIEVDPAHDDGPEGILQSRGMSDIIPPGRWGEPIDPGGRAQVAASNNELVNAKVGMMVTLKDGHKPGCYTFPCPSLLTGKQLENAWSNAVVAEKSSEREVGLGGCFINVYVISSPTYSLVGSMVKISSKALVAVLREEPRRELAFSRPAAAGPSAQPAVAEAPPPPTEPHT